MKSIGKIILYSAFIYIGFSLAKSNHDQRVIYYVITVLVLLFNLFYDLLKHLLSNIMKSIAQANDPQVTEKKIKHLESLDIFKGLTNSLIIPKILLSIDKKEPNDTLNILKTNERFLKSKPDYLLILKYATFKASTLKNHPKDSLESYSALIKLKESNLKSKHMSLLYNWDQIEALHLYTLKKYRQALIIYESINTKHFNKREMLHYTYEKTMCEYKLNNVANMKKCTEKLIQLSPNSPYTLEWSQ